MTRKVLKLSCLASFAALAFTSWRAASYYSRAVSTTKQEVLDLTNKGAGQLDMQLRVVMAAAQGLADDLSSGKIPYGRIDDSLKKTLNALPPVRSANVAFAPGAYKP